MYLYNILSPSTSLTDCYLTVCSLRAVLLMCCNHRKVMQYVCFSQAFRYCVYMHMCSWLCKCYSHFYCAVCHDYNGFFNSGALSSGNLVEAETLLQEALELTQDDDPCRYMFKFLNFTDVQWSIACSTHMCVCAYCSTHSSKPDLILERLCICDCHISILCACRADVMSKLGTVYAATDRVQV
jgi:hypothetical protein